MHRQNRQNKANQDMTEQKKLEISPSRMTSKSSIADREQEREPSPSLDIAKMITRHQVADYLKVSIQTVINYTNRGLLTAHKIGRRVLYNEDEVKAALQSCAVKRYQHESTRLYIFKK